MASGGSKRLFSMEMDCFLDIKKISPRLGFINCDEFVYLFRIAAELFDELHRVKISEHEFLGPEEQLDIKRLKAISESYGIETTEENQWETFLSTVHLRLKARLESFTSEFTVLYRLDEKRVRSGFGFVGCWTGGRFDNQNF